MADIAVKIGATADRSDIHPLWHDGCRLLGADHAVFVLRRHDELAIPECCLMLDCDPAWGLRYLEADGPTHDPWLAYATAHSEPMVAGALDVSNAAGQRIVQIAREHGFASTVLIPTHSGLGQSYLGLMCLGSSIPGYFEHRQTALDVVLARMLAQSLFDWWIAAARRELLVSVPLSKRDLRLLRYAAWGYSSKRIASEEGVSIGSVDSRYQRLMTKLGISHRKVVTRLAQEHGLFWE